MEYRIPRKSVNKNGVATNFPKICIVCGRPSSENCYADIHYHPNVKTTKELKNFILKLPLCKRHSEEHDQGKKQAKLSMYLLFSAIIPFIVGLLLVEFANTITGGIIAFVIAAAITGSGFYFWNPSNEMLKQSRGKLEIKMVTGHEVILKVKNEKLAALIKEKS